MRTDIVNGIPKDTERWLYEVLHTLAMNQESAGRGLDAISRGEAPDGSGTQLFNDSLLFKLPGRSGGQDAHGDTAPGGNLTLSSTSSDTKGFIYLGDAQTSMFDEANQRIGLNTIPLARLHQKHTALETMQRWEGPNTAVTSCICNGTTTVTHGSSGFANLSIGTVVYGAGVPTATYILSSTSSTLVLNNAVTAGTKTLSFANIIDLNYEVNGSGSDAIFRSSAGIVFIGSSLTGGQQSGIRLTAQTAFDGVIRAFIEAGPGSANMAITGNNGGGGDSLQQLFSRIALNTFNGTALTGDSRVGINQDPYSYSNSAASGQPDALLIARRASATSGVPTVVIEATSSTELAFAVTPVSLGTAPTKTLNTPLMGIRHNGDIVLYTGSNAAGLLNGVNVHGANNVFLNVTRVSDATSVFTLGSNATWSDTLTDAQGKLALLGDISGGHRAFILASSGFAAFTRFGISSAYTLISNGQCGGFASSFPAPSGMILRVQNTTTLGADGTVVVTIQTDRAGQTGDLLRLVGSAGTVLGGFTAAGNPYLVSGAGAGKIFTSDAGGVASWATGSSLATRIQQRWVANGPFRVGTSVDGGYIATSAFTISAIWLYRTTPGSASSSILDLNKNGTTMYTTQANRPTIAFNDSDSKVQATLPDIVSVAAGDILTIDIDQIETGTPGDIILIIEGA